MHYYEKCIFDFVVISESTLFALNIYFFAAFIHFSLYSYDITLKSRITSGRKIILLYFIDDGGGAVIMYVFFANMLDFRPERRHRVFTSYNNFKQIKNSSLRTRISCKKILRIRIHSRQYLNRPTDTLMTHTLL